MNSKQRLFALEYLTDLNATQAAIRAGYSQRTARAIGHENLTKPDIAAFIDEQLEKRQAKLEQAAQLDVDQVVDLVTHVLMVDVGEAFNADGSFKAIHEIPEDVRRAISAVESEELWEGRGGKREQVGVLRKVKFWNKLEASQQLLRVLGAFRDRVEVSTSHADLVVEASKRIAARCSGSDGATAPRSSAGVTTAEEPPASPPPPPPPRDIQKAEPQLEDGKHPQPTAPRAGRAADRSDQPRPEPQVGSRMLTSQERLARFAQRRPAGPEQSVHEKGWNR